jgi:hypothetical protein
MVFSLQVGSGLGGLFVVVDVLVDVFSRLLFLPVGVHLIVPSLNLPHTPVKFL